MIGVGVGGVFVNTLKLNAMKYNEAMTKYEEVWAKTVEEEHHIMV